jgi:hypothetical protein
VIARERLASFQDSRPSFCRRFDKISRDPYPEHDTPRPYRRANRRLNLVGSEFRARRKGHNARIITPGRIHNVSCRERAMRRGDRTRYFGLRSYSRMVGQLQVSVFTFDVRGHLADSVLTRKTCTSDISTVISWL